MWADWVVGGALAVAIGFGLYSIIFRRRVSLSMVEADSFRSSAALLHTQFGRARLRLDRKLLEARRMDVFSRLERRRRVVAMIEAEQANEQIDDAIEDANVDRATARRLREDQLRGDEGSESDLLNDL